MASDDGASRGWRLLRALFPVLLAALSEILVQLTGWSRLPVLLVVFCAGYAVLAVVRRSRRRAAVDASPSPRTTADAPGD